MHLQRFYKSAITMIFSPARNCQNFFVLRKPLLIFFVCLLIMMSTTFFLAYYVKNTDKIINSDAEDNWVSLVHHLDKQELCFTDTADNINETIDVRSFATTVKVDFSQFYEFTKIRITYGLKGWHTANPQTSSFFQVDLNLPPNWNDTDSNTTACALITGPKKYLPENSNQCIFNNQFDDNVTLTLESCPTPDNEIKIQFDKNATFEIYLTQDDKIIIYLHLMWSTYILLFFIVIMLSYAMFHQVENTLEEHRRT